MRSITTNEPMPMPIEKNACPMASAMKFLLEPDFSKVTFSTAMMAIGQAFFSIGIGMGSLVVFGAYMPKDFSYSPGAPIVNDYNRIRGV